MRGGEGMSPPRKGLLSGLVKTELEGFPATREARLKPAQEIRRRLTTG